LETHAPWSPVVPDLQRGKLNLQMYQSKQQRKIRTGGRDVAKAGGIRKETVIWTHKIKFRCNR
jgi:hypothetical protein